MSCNCIGAKLKDLEFVRKLAKILSQTEKQDVQIHHYTKIGLGKVYGFNIAKEGRSQVVETIVFQEDESKDILSDATGSGSESTKQTWKERTLPTFGAQMV